MNFDKMTIQEALNEFEKYSNSMTENQLARAQLYAEMTKKDLRNREKFRDRFHLRESEWTVLYKLGTGQIRPAFADMHNIRLLLYVSRLSLKDQDSIIKKGIQVYSRRGTGDKRAVLLKNKNTMNTEDILEVFDFNVYPAKKRSTEEQLVYVQQREETRNILFKKGNWVCNRNTVLTPAILKCALRTSKILSSAELLALAKELED